ncbi:hypothetical protein Cjcuy013_09060, partial [Campylobacter jejuni]|nr:hypothetical protein [Campylobacter jejuni]
MIIIFLMAGLSSRFAKAGYNKATYMLDLKGNSVFFHAVNSFKKYFKDFKEIFDKMKAENDFSKGELYIAPMYNYLINKGLLVKYHKI